MNIAVLVWLYYPYIYIYDIFTSLLHYSIYFSLLIVFYCYIMCIIYLCYIVLFGLMTTKLNTYTVENGI